ncbi:MAG TPA: FumA C-terminus/TtdB family hydratase beta subunit [Phycisphaerae bacterium]|nr:FumA C-terminus/TtdB family hydratase beta subunit [Phycisphaerae bacterium]HNU45383.1 FumA C-terminus/TtdB family hydratase beta subunit [Phycisphaerae bacterium]
MATKLTVPISEEQIRALKVGDQVLLSGVIFTGRDAAHKYMVESFIKGPCPDSEKKLYDMLKKELAGSVIYHCGPVVKKRPDGKYDFVAAGPTTSIREEPYQADVIGHFGVRGVIGKGGMREKTLEGCRRHGAVYLHAIGGAATLIAETVKEVVDVYKLDFGVPEAFWKIRVVDFPCVVTMDTHGQSLHDRVEAESKRKLEALLAR